MNSSHRKMIAASIPAKTPPDFRVIAVDNSGFA
jgi:hypothetical protein